MSTILEKAQLALNSKNAIKEALIEKCVFVNNEFSEYAAIIKNIVGDNFTIKSQNLFNKEIYDKGTYGTTGNTFTSSTTNYTSDYIEVEANKTYERINGANTLFVYAYDENKQPVIVSGGNVYWIKAFETAKIPSTVKYIRAIFPAANIDSFMISEKGTIPEGEYIPYINKTFNEHFSTFSIIGDSYCTFKNFVNPSTNKVYYPINDPTTQGYGTENDVNNIEETWWYIFANLYKSRLIENNSYSGSTVCSDGYNEGHDTANYDISFHKRVENMTKPTNVIFVFGAINDSWANSELGDYKYSNWTDDDKSYFRPALAYTINYLKQHHIGTKIIFVLNNGLKTDINTSVDAVCAHYGVKVIKLSNIDKVSGHPTKLGMKQIAYQIINNL